MLTFPTLESADILTVAEARVTTNPFTFDVPLLQSFFAQTAWEEDNEVRYWVGEFLAGSVCSALHYILNVSMVKTERKILSRLNDESATLQQQESEAEKLTVFQLRRENVEELFSLAQNDYVRDFGETWKPSATGSIPSRVIGFDPSVLEKLKVA
jgi:hypothetical protein